MGSGVRLSYDLGSDGLSFGRLFTYYGCRESETKLILKTVLFTFLLSWPLWGWSQSYPLKGQIAATSFPICTLDTFKQGVLPDGFDAGFVIPGCDLFYEYNPFYYRFSCFASGTLGFVITPNLPNDN